MTGGEEEVLNSESQRNSKTGELNRLREENRQLQYLITNLSVHERMFHSLFELSHDGIILLDDEVVFDCNANALDLFRFSSSELLQQQMHKIILTESIAEFRRNLNAAVKEGPQFFEFQFISKEGALLDCEVSVAAFMLYHRQFFMVSIRDITDRKKTEDNLRIKTAQLQATINSFPFDFWINDTQNRTLMQNPGSKLLWGNQSGSHLEEVTEDESIKAHWRETNRRALQGEVVETEQSYHIDGRQRVFRNIVAPVWEKERVIGILGLNIDITDYKTTQQQLSHALEERETLLREIHHRVKNNLQLIISMLNLQKPNIDSEKLDVVVDIENRINSMALIHEQLYGSSTLNRIHMPTYFDQMVATIIESFQREGQSISVEVNSIEVSLPIDTALPLGIIVNELVCNSMKYAFKEIEQGEIRIELLRSADGAEYVLSVEDNGGGCEINQTESAGGLGLTLVRQLTAQIGGSVSFGSGGVSGVGRGSARASGFSAAIEFPAGEK